MSNTYNEAEKVTPFGPIQRMIEGSRESEQQIKEMSDTIDKMSASLMDTEHKLQSARSELEYFKEKVASVAQEYAVSYKWCNTVREALQELGIDHYWVESVYTATIRVEIQVKGTCEATNVDYDYVHNSLDTNFRTMLESGEIVLLDSDWEDVSVHSVEFSVSNVERYDD